MTLCIAWKHSSGIYFASDSRISLPRDNKIDLGIKVLPIPIRIFEPAETGNVPPLIYEHTLGMCFAGGALTGYIVKESVQEALRGLQAIPGHTDFSFEGICKLVMKFYEHACRTIGEQLFNRGLIEMLLGGYCPEQKRIRVFKFSVDITDAKLDTSLMEVFTNSPVVLLGSGKRAAENLLRSKNYPPPRYLRVLKDVIQDENVPSVGGYIQFGEFVSPDFELKGVMHYDVGLDGRPEQKAILRGTQLYVNEFQTNFEDFFIAYSFIDPFRDEFDRLMQEYMKQFDM